MKKEHAIRKKNNVIELGKRNPPLFHSYLIVFSTSFVMFRTFYVHIYVCMYPYIKETQNVCGGSDRRRRCAGMFDDLRLRGHAPLLRQPISPRSDFKSFPTSLEIVFHCV